MRERRGGGESMRGVFGFQTSEGWCGGQGNSERSGLADVASFSRRAVLGPRSCDPFFAGFGSSRLNSSSPCHEIHHQQ